MANQNKGWFKKGHKINLGRTWTVSDETRKKISERQIGKIVKSITKSKISLSLTGRYRDETSPHWKGDKIGYSSLHRWIHKKFGSPNKCENCGFESPSNRKIHWARKTNTYSRERKNWIRLCVPCHKKHDMTPEMRKMYQKLMLKNVNSSKIS